jgi:hypothetical protein
MQNVKIIDMIQRLDFVKFIVMRDDNQITVDYYYNTTIEDAMTTSELGDVMKHVDTLIMCGFDPFYPTGPNPEKYPDTPIYYDFTFDDIPNVKNIWMSSSERYESQTLYMTATDFKEQIVEACYEGDWYLYWYENHSPDSDSDDDSDDDNCDYSCTNCRMISCC